MYEDMNIEGQNFLLSRFLALMKDNTFSILNYLQHLLIHIVKGTNLIFNISNYAY